MAKTTSHTDIEYVTLEVPDPDAAAGFYRAFGVDHCVRLREATAPSTGFRGYAMTLTTAQPADVDLYLAAATAAGATVVKPAEKALWGYGGTVQAPDGTYWRLGSSSKKNTGPGVRAIERVVLLLGVEDVKAGKRYYAEHGLAVAKSFGGKYAEFEPGASGPVSLALYPRAGLAKELGVPVDGTGSHRIAIGSTATPFTDPDGYAWEAAETSAAAASPASPASPAGSAGSAGSAS